MGHRVFEADKYGKLSIYPSLYEPKHSRFYNFIRRVLDRIRSFISYRGSA